MLEEEEGLEIVAGADDDQRIWRRGMQLRKTGKETAERRQVEDAINSVRAKLPEPILGHYDRQKSRGKLGIAPVRGGVCGACHLKMPVGHVAELRHKQDDLALCDNCGTYYLPPDEMALSPMAPARRDRGRARTPLTHV